MAGTTVPQTIAAALESPELQRLIERIDESRWLGPRGYGAKALVGACLVRSLYGFPTWSRVARLIEEHQGLQDALGGAPSQWACYRFLAKLRGERELLEECITRVVRALRARKPEYGQDVAIDSTDLAAYANGQKYKYRGGPEREAFSDPDASWGHRSAVSTRKGGGFYGYKLHMAACTHTDLTGRVGGSHGKGRRHACRSQPARPARQARRSSCERGDGQGLRLPGGVRGVQTTRNAPGGVQAPEQRHG